MTPLPKKRHAKARTRRRKSTKKLILPGLITCPKCTNLKFPHIVCKSCGYYKDEREIGSKTSKSN